MSNRKPVSIREEIEVLARLTGAPCAFVEQVRALFTNKTISLSEDAGPYRLALEEAFRREETIRGHADRVRVSFAAVDQSLESSRQASRGEVERLRKVRETVQSSVLRLRENARQLDAIAAALRPGWRVHREHDSAPVVPGPKDLQ